MKMVQKADLLSAAKSALVPQKSGAKWPVVADVPLSMEQIGQNYGFVLYETEVTVPAPKEVSFAPFPRDRAHVFINGTMAIAEPISRVDGNKTVPLTAASRSSHGNLQILVENMGRINYGLGMTDHKGIEGKIAGEAVIVNGENVRP